MFPSLVFVFWNSETREAFEGLVQVLLGDMGAGKSSLVLRFVKGQFTDFQVCSISIVHHLTKRSGSAAVFVYECFLNTWNKGADRKMWHKFVYAEIHRCCQGSL